MNIWFYLQLFIIGYLVNVKTLGTDVSSAILRKIESRNCGLCVVHTVSSTESYTLLVGTW